MTNPKTPTISVIIPTCHRNDLLARCLECLAPGTQTLSPELYEVIVTDDGSRFTAQALIAERYPWAQWVSGPRKGPAANRNNGASHAIGEFIAFTDDDCLPSTDWLTAYASAIEAGIDVYEGKTTCNAGIRSPIEEAPVNLTGGCLWSCNFMMRRVVYVTVGGFDARFIVPGGEDIDLRERLVKSSYVFPFVKAAVVDHPPRKSRWGASAGELWESQVLLWYRIGKRRFAPARLLLLVAKVRVKNLTRFPIQQASFLAVISLVLELTYIVRHVSTWQAKHSSEGERSMTIKGLTE